MTAAGPITDITWAQPMPLHPAMGDGGNTKHRIGFAAPVGGIGPYSFSLSGHNTNVYGIDAAAGFIFLPYASVGSTADTFNVVCVDGNGSSFSKSITIQKTATDPFLFFDAPLSYNDDFSNLYDARSYVFRAYGTGHSGSDTRAVSDPGGIFYVDYGQTRMHSKPANGPLSITASCTGAGGTLTTTVALTQVAAAPIATIQLVPLVVSTSLPEGSLIGTACATTPNNIPVWSLTNNAGGKYIINSVTGAVTTTGLALSVGTDTIAIQVTDVNVTRTDTFQINVVQGYLLDPVTMTFTPGATLNNYLFNSIYNPRTVGTAAASGITGTKSWSVIQSRAMPFLYYAIYFPKCYPFEIDQTGVVTTRHQLGAGVKTFTVVCTDRINTIIKVISATINAIAGPTMYLGRGMVAAHGALGFDHFRDFAAAFQFSRDLGSKANATIIVMPDSDPDYYADDNGCSQDVNNGGTGYNYALRFGLQGPFTLRGNPGGARPRFGGKVGSAIGGISPANGFLDIVDGDVTIENLEFSFCHGGPFANGGIPSNGGSAISLDQMYDSGIVTINNCYIHDCDNGIHSGGNCDTLIIKNTEIGNCSGSTTGQGYDHNLYLGAHAEITIDNVYSWGPMIGQVFKARGLKGTITNSRFYDTERGAASVQIDLPDGGDWLIDGCDLQKGPMPQNPYSINFNTEFDLPIAQDNKVNRLIIQNSKLRCHSPQSQVTAAIFDNVTKSRIYSTYSSVESHNNTFIGWSSGTLFFVQNAYSPFFPSGDAHDGSVVTSGTVISTTFSALDISHPITPGPTSRPRWHNASADTENRQHYPYIHGVQIDPGVDDVVIAANAPIGTVVFTPVAYGVPNYQLSSNTQPDPLINPFAGGATWSFGITPKNYYGQSFGLSNGKYAINPSTGQVTVAQALIAGLDLIEIRAVSTGAGAGVANIPVEQIFSVTVV